MESELTQNTAGEKFGLKLVLDAQTVIDGLYQLYFFLGNQYVREVFHRTDDCVLRST